MKTANPVIAVKQRMMRELKNLDEMPSRILVAVSGGVDSVVLLHLLVLVRARFGFELEIAHVHHGFSSDPQVNSYRKMAQEFVAGLAEELGLHFHTNVADAVERKSESELRDLRFSLLHEWRKDADCIALGHHREDLLETQMMRLMRGSAALGLGAMSLLSPAGRLRPLLNFSKAEIRECAAVLRLRWIEDPSNRSQSPLRNRVRELLKIMDEMHPGATKNLFLSLQRLVRLTRAMDKALVQGSLTDRGIDRSSYRELARPLQLHTLAAYVRRLGADSYTSGQLEELRKHLDRSQKRLRFDFMGFYWDISEDLICARGV